MQRRLQFSSPEPVGALAGFELPPFRFEPAGYADVGIKSAIEKGIIPGPRLLVTTKVIVATGPWVEGRMPQNDYDLVACLPTEPQPFLNKPCPNASSLLSRKHGHRCQSQGLLYLGPGDYRQPAEQDVADDLFLDLGDQGKSDKAQRRILPDPRRWGSVRAIPNVVNCQFAGGDKQHGVAGPSVTLRNDGPAP